MANEKSLIVVNPRLAREWHPTKNIGLTNRKGEDISTPDKVSANSRQKVWWLLPYDDPKTGKHFEFEWQASIGNRNKGVGCPFLVNQKIWPGYNDLQSTNPELIDEWDFEKNGLLLPNMVSNGTEKKVWWKCKKGHSWSAYINPRAKRNVGCPKCNNEKQTSFAEYAILYYLKMIDETIVHSYRDLGFELDIYIPSKKVAIEYDGVFWHKKTIKKDLKKNDLCKKNNIILYRFRENDLGALNDYSIDIITPEEKLADKLHELIFKLYNINIDVNLSRDYIKIQSLRELQEKKKSLAIINPELAEEWNTNKNGDLTPETINCSSAGKVWWICQLGHEWVATVASRNAGNGCPYCANKLVLKGYNDLATVNPDLAKEWHPTKNDETSADVTEGSNKKVWWLLSYDDPGTGKHFDFEWQASIASRNKGVGCPFLAGKDVWPGYNDLATTHPQLVKEWHPTKNGLLKPTDVTAGSERLVWWLLPYDDPRTGKHFDFEWQAKVCNKVSNIDCPIISNKILWSGYNDLATLNPDLAKEWHPIKNGSLLPSDVFPNDTKKVWWLLPYDDPRTGKHFNFEWQAKVNNRNQGKGCPYLNGTKIWSGYNDLATLNPNLAKEWHPTKNVGLCNKFGEDISSPSKVTSNSGQKVWWKCSVCGYEWDANISDRNGGNGCIKCSRGKR